MQIVQKTHLEILPSLWNCWDFEPKMANICPFSLKIGLPTNTDPNDGQNKFEVRNSKNVAKMSNIWVKIGQMPLWRKDF